MPEVFAELAGVFARSRSTIATCRTSSSLSSSGKLWMLQTRTASAPRKAALRIAVDMVDEGLITGRRRCCASIPRRSISCSTRRSIPKAERKVIAKGLPASPGAASGEVVFDADDAEELRRTASKVILVRIETSPEDIHGMHAAEGILTARGGMTSHAAVVARGMGRPCVSGAGALASTTAAQAHVGRRRSVSRRARSITLDGATGEVIAGEVPTREPALAGDFATLMAWADEERRLRVRANADTPLDAASRASSAPRASASAAPSTCSSTPSGSSPCAR